MDKRIKEYLKCLNKYYLLLKQSRNVPYNQFLEDPIHYGSTERFLQLAIESCLNIGNRLLALYQFTMPINTPETYADIFKEMHRLGVVDSEFSKRLLKMARFRNRLVHLYWRIDPSVNLIPLSFYVLLLSLELDPLSSYALSFSVLSLQPVVPT